MSSPGSPTTIAVDATINWRGDIPSTTARLRSAIVEMLARHTDLVVAAVDITVTDVHADEAEGSRSPT